MIVRVPVVIKAKVTDDLKAKIIADMKRQVQAAELDFEQFQFNAKRALNEQAAAGPDATRGSPGADRVRKKRSAAVRSRS